MLLRVAFAGFAAIASLGLQVGMAPLIGQGGATLCALLVAAWLAVQARAVWRRHPAELRIDARTGGLAAFDRTGSLMAEGRIAGCTQWSDLLLVLEVRSRAGRAVSLLIPADALDASAFRVLSVLGRRASRGGLAKV